MRDYKINELLNRYKEQIKMALKESAIAVDKDEDDNYIYKKVPKEIADQRILDIYDTTVMKYLTEYVYSKHFNKETMKLGSEIYMEILMSSKTEEALAELPFNYEEGRYGEVNCINMDVPVIPKEMLEE